MEAALVGVPTIASPTDAFASAIRSGENGLLASCPQEWLDGLLWLVGETAEREKLGAAAREDVLRRYAPWVRAEQAVAALQAAGLELSANLPASLSTGIDPLERKDLWMAAEAEKHPTARRARTLFSAHPRACHPGERSLGLSAPPGRAGFPIQTQAAGSVPMNDQSYSPPDFSICIVTLNAVKLPAGLLDLTARQHAPGQLRGDRRR